MSRGMSSISEISKDAKAWPFIEAKKIIKKAQANNKQKIRLQTRSQASEVTTTNCSTTTEAHM